MKEWIRFVKKQEVELGAANCKKWLSSISIAQFDARNLYLEVADAFVREWFEQHLRSKAEAELKTVSGKPIRIHVALAKQNIISETPHQEVKQQLHFTCDSVDPYAHFENFVCDKENHMTFQIFQEAGKLEEFNPIYLYGPKGSGKSHLLMALCKKMRQEGLRVFYVCAENFMRHVVSAIRGGEMEKFRKVYREIDVLLFDDVHELAKRKATQEEFFHTFNLLHTAGKQIVLSSNIPQGLLGDIEERLVSRFEWGLTLTLTKPTERLCREIVVKRSEELCFPLTGEVVDYLLDEFSTTTALIEALNALVLRSHLGKKERIHLNEAKGFLQELCKKEKGAALTSEVLAHVVAEVFGIKHEDILGKSQCREFVLPRQLAMYLCRNKLKMPYTKIGHTFSKDHSTVMSSVKNIEEALHKESREMHTYLCDIERRLSKF